MKKGRERKVKKRKKRKKETDRIRYGYMEVETSSKRESKRGIKRENKNWERQI